MTTALFSDSEVAALCLRDRRRTEAFREAIELVVRPGDLVVDIGAGSGILSFFAARAGARKVVAVESSPALCEILRSNVRANRFAEVIEVIQGDARDVALPRAVDVVIAELIETWLLDELQLPVLASLRARGVVAGATRLIPHRYDGWVSFGEADFSLYGFEMPFPVHDWPDLDTEGGWIDVPFRPVAERVRAFELDLGCGPEALTEVSARLRPRRSAVVNAARLTGEVHLGGGVRLRDTPCFNGAKVVPVQPTQVRRGRTVEFVFGSAGGAASSLASWRCQPRPRSPSPMAKRLAGNPESPQAEPTRRW